MKWILKKILGTKNERDLKRLRPVRITRLRRHVLKHLPPVQEREPIRESFATAENSDWSRTTDEEYVQFSARYGVGTNVPFATCKVNAA